MNSLRLHSTLCTTIKIGNGKEELERKSGEPASWDGMAEKFEELETRLAEHFENNGENNREAPPIIRAPDRPTKEEWARH